MERYFKLVEITADEYESGTGYIGGPWCQTIDPVDGAVYIATYTDELSIEIDMDTIECAFGEADEDAN